MLQAVDDAVRAARRDWMGVLARAPLAMLEQWARAAQTGGSLPQRTWLRPPETGLVMLRARAGKTRMSTVPMDRIVAGLQDPVFDSQRVFRAALRAISRPGTVVAVPAQVGALPGVHPAASALLLSLLGPENRLWLSPSLSADVVGANLRFHTGCAVVADCGEADFALVASPAEPPPLVAFPAGSDEHPERSASIVLQVVALADSGRWRLSGPGVAGERRIEVAELGADFRAQWAENHLRFPRGVDLYLACGERLCALARTTRTEA